MNTRLFISFAILAVFIFLLHPTVLSTDLTSNSDSNFIIRTVATHIDLTTQLVNIVHKISLTPTKDNLKSFFFQVEPYLSNSVANISAFINRRKNEILKMNYVDNGVWKIIFKETLVKNKTELIHVKCVLTHILTSFPSKVTQGGKHFVIYNGPISLYSMYPIFNHSSFVDTGNGQLISVSSPPNFKMVDPSKLIFTYESVTAEKFVNSLSRVHYEHLNMFLTVKMLLRVIEVSHWGSIRVTETIELEHSGPKLYGPFHRQFHGKIDSMAIDSVITILPVSATDISVYDDIGNISSTHIREKFDCVEMRYSPRFPLYGGWKVKYTVSYNVPAYEYLFNDGEQFILSMRIIDHIFNNMVVDYAVIKLILPEGSVTNNLKTPYPVKHLNDSYYVSYLDIVGRSVITFSKYNLVEEHIQDFFLSYSFTKYKMLFEPLYVILFIELFFILYIVYVRIDLSLVDKEINNDKPKVLGNEINDFPMKIKRCLKLKKKHH